MTAESASRIWFMRGLFGLLTLVILFGQLLPIETQARRPGPVSIC